jgi:hypothetical protein
VRTRANGLITALIISFEVVKIYFFLRADPEPQHSGFVYAQSIAVSNGLIPNRNFLSPYGVIGPILNGAWIKLIGDSLFGLLFFYGLLTIVIGYLIQRICSRYVGRSLAVLLNLTWVITLATTMPWPSIISTLLCLFSLTVLLENREKLQSFSNSSSLFLIPVIIALQLASLTRIHLILVPAAISLFLLIYRESLNGKIIRYWFLGNLLSGSLFILILHLSGALPGYIEQVIVWPLTEFAHPRFNISWWFSFIWFPLFFLLLLSMIFMGLKIISLDKNILTMSYLTLVTSIFYTSYYFSQKSFRDVNINTLRNLSGLIKNTSVNSQFIVGYCAGMFFVVGLCINLVLLVKNRFWRLKECLSLENFLMILMGISGLMQLYPLRDNVHLWFISPLLIVPSIYYFKLLVTNIRSISSILVLILSCFVFVQCVAINRFLDMDRVPLKSYELRGMVGRADFHLDVDKTMQQIDTRISGRVLRNNCVDSLYSIGRGKYLSIDGNFAANSFGNFVQRVPRVDTIETSPKFVFECRVTNSQIENFRQKGLIVVFKQPLTLGVGSTDVIYNVLLATQIK